MTQFAQPGDVLRWVKAWNTDISDAPMYALVLGHSLAKIIVAPDKYRKIDEGCGTWLDNDPWRITYIYENRYAKAELVPQDEWPDEVCRAVALYRLTGEVS